MTVGGEGSETAALADLGGGARRQQHGEGRRKGAASVGSFFLLILWVGPVGDDARKAGRGA